MTRTCCIVNCSTSLANSESNKRTIFKIPTDPDKQQSWLDVISPYLKKGRTSRKNLYVCELHFKESDLNRNYSTVLRDGSTHKMARGILSLKSTSVPCIFNNYQRSIVENSEEKSMDQEMDNKNFPSSGYSVTEHSYSRSDKLISEEASLNTYDIAALEKDLEILKLSNSFPVNWGHCKTSLGIILFYFGDTFSTVTRSIMIKKDMTVQIRANNNIAKLNILEKVGCLLDISSAMAIISRLYRCQGIDNLTPCDYGFFESMTYRPNSVGYIRCVPCQAKRKQKLNIESKRIKRSSLKVKKSEKMMKNLKQECNRLRKNITSAKKNIEKLKSQCASTSEKSIEDSIQNFSDVQKEAVRACLTAAKCKGSTGVRYTHAWILECLLLRIKSRRAYIHVRNNEILQMPSIETLNNYLKKMKPSYGFCREIFEHLRVKAAEMKPEDKRGTLVLDEMKLSEAVWSDSNNLSFSGFADLSDYTPKHKKNVHDDYALVFLFQPFRGKWVQTVAAFLSKGCASSIILHKLILECIILLENAGFYVDVVTTDGAPWNRTMWKNFGLTESDCSCEHPCSSGGYNDDHGNVRWLGRRLWWMSDFSHAGNNFRNLITNEIEIWTPDGIVKKSHFEAVLTGDEGIKQCAHKLTHNHLNPKYYQKMNVGIAYQLFSPQVSTAMHLYKKDNKNLHDCESTIKFIDRLHKVIVAMTSRSSEDALAFNTESYKTIKDFQQYLDEWHTEATKKGYRFFSANTFESLKVTLKATLEISEFLTEVCEYEYLMTSRLNQDALEGFFSMIRSAYGSSDHPDSLLFIQTYRLMCCYSLVKPPKSLNVEGADVFETLLTLKDKEDHQVNDNQEQWNSILDQIVERGENNAKKYDMKDGHDYNVFHTNEDVQAYFSGFVAYKIHKWTSCSTCLSSICQTKGDSSRDEIINRLSEGRLKYPSDNLFDLLSAVERAILKTVGHHQELNCYSFLHLAENILAENLLFVGCPEHKDTLTRNVINYYTVIRERILCKAYK